MTETETDALQERADRLSEKVDQGYPKSWIAKPGEKLIGVFQRLDRGYTSYGHAWVVVLQPLDSEEERSIWLLHTALRNQFKKAAPEPGELVAVRYEGKARSNNGTEYDNWTVRVDRVDKPTDWSQVTGDNEPPPAVAGSDPSWSEFDGMNTEDDVPF
jgi:hypothetical protein